jgi:anti-sigma B factor antagonist
MDAGLTIQVRHEQGYDVVTVAGEIDVATVATLREPLNALAESGRLVIADLNQVGFMDASGLGVIVGASRRAAAHGASLHVVCGRRTRQLFHVTGLDRQVPLARTLDEALQGLRSGQQEPP